MGHFMYANSSVRVSYFAIDILSVSTSWCRAHLADFRLHTKTLTYQCDLQAASSMLCKTLLSFAGHRALTYQHEQELPGHKRENPFF
jgi:hypothetical protein